MSEVTILNHSRRKNLLYPGTLNPLRWHLTLTVRFFIELYYFASIALVNHFMVYGAVLISCRASWLSSRPQWLASKTQIHNVNDSTRAELCRWGYEWWSHGWKVWYADGVFPKIIALSRPLGLFASLSRFAFPSPNKLLDGRVDGLPGHILLL